MSMANGWTEERRQRQVKLIREKRPWDKSSGPKTAEGKAKSSRNAYKGGTRPLLRQLARVLRKLDNNIV